MRKILLYEKGLHIVLMKLTPGAISPTFYMKLLHAQIPKAQKKIKLSIFFLLLGSALVKAQGKHVHEMDTRGQFQLHIYTQLLHP